jgi:hypothetical protein
MDPIYQPGTDPTQFPTSRSDERTRLAFLERDYPLVVERANREAQLASDLRTSQDAIIERCAKAVEGQWPDAAAAIRQHVDGISGEDFGDLRRHNESLYEMVGRLRSTLCRFTCPRGQGWHADLCILARRVLERGVAP